MVIQPKVRGFMCTTSHPVGCEANVREQIAYVKAQAPVANGPKKVLVIGASTGYGLASRISAAFGAGAATIGIFFEKPAAGKRTASAGWYNSAAFQKVAAEDGLYAKSINGDAFSSEIKAQTIALIKQDLGQVDMVVYSLAAPRRTHPVTGETFSSCLKPIGKAVTQRGINTDKEVIEEVTLEPATEQDITNTVAVMGGEDWLMWMEALKEAGVLAEGCVTTAYTYLGDRVTWDIYWHGTIGAAKKDLDTRSIQINELLHDLHGKAYVSVLKAVVTQASSAIPIMPLYLSLLFKVMKADGSHEGCIEQVRGLFDLLCASTPEMDEAKRLRRDQLELRPEVQDAVEKAWEQVTTDNIYQTTDFQGYKDEFLRLFGFGVHGVDYDADVDPDVAIENLV
ncbi:MAG TPA: enoyl-ACP reductase FabV [Pseudomonadales bacterium]|nr:enoyl-ACP reductase FabV [Pseudomonadales bacterium]